MEINRFFFKKTAPCFLSLYLSLTLAFPPLVLAELQNTVDAQDTENVFLYVGDLVTVKVGN